MVTPEDYETARLVVEVDPGRFAVPSISQSLPNGDPLTRVVDVTADARGLLSMCCDCEAGALAYKRVVCRHKRAVVAWLRLQSESKENP